SAGTRGRPRRGDLSGARAHRKQPRRDRKDAWGPRSHDRAAQLPPHRKAAPPGSRDATRRRRNQKDAAGKDNSLDGEEFLQMTNSWGKRVTPLLGFGPD